MKNKIVLPILGVCAWKVKKANCTFEGFSGQQMFDFMVEMQASNIKDVICTPRRAIEENDRKHVCHFTRPSDGARCADIILEAPKGPK